MPAVRGYAIKTFTIDNTQFWPIRAPYGCATWSLRGAVDFLIRTDPDDTATEDTVIAGDQEGAITSTAFMHLRYAAGDVVIYAKKSTAGATVLVGRFLD